MHEPCRVYIMYVYYNTYYKYARTDNFIMASMCKVYYFHKNQEYSSPKPFKYTLKVCFIVLVNWLYILYCLKYNHYYYFCRWSISFKAFIGSALSHWKTDLRCDCFLQNGHFQQTKSQFNGLLLKTSLNYYIYNMGQMIDLLLNAMRCKIYMSIAAINNFLSFLIACISNWTFFVMHLTF